QNSRPGQNRSRATYPDWKVPEKDFWQSIAPCRRHPASGHEIKLDGFRLMARARRERSSRRAANQRNELAASHCPMPPVLPTERIAPLGRADCCIRPPGRNEMIAITPPVISSKEVAQKQATPFPRQDLLTARNRFT